MEAEKEVEMEMEVEDEVEAIKNILLFTLNIINYIISKILNLYIIDKEINPK